MNENSDYPTVDENKINLPFIDIYDSGVTPDNKKTPNRKETAIFDQAKQSTRKIKNKTFTNNATTKFIRCKVHYYERNTTSNILDRDKNHRSNIKN